MVVIPPDGPEGGGGREEQNPLIANPGHERVSFPSCSHTPEERHISGHPPIYFTSRFNKPPSKTWATDSPSFLT